MGKKLLIFLGLGALGAFFIYGGIDAVFWSARSPDSLAAEAARGEPSELLIPPSVFIFGLIAIVFALRAISPETDFDDGYFWAHGPRGVTLILGSLLSLLFPPLFIWQLWILFTRDIFKGIPPIAWGRVGGVVSDWVIFGGVLFIPWMLIALAGILGPPILFWKGLIKK